MATKSERSIPIKVKVDPRPAPTSLPPVPEAHLKPQPKPSQPQRVVAQLKKVSPVHSIKKPVHEWPEDKRRRLMWWLVGGGTAVVIIGWLAVVRLELSGEPGQNLFSETKKLFSNFHLPGAPKSNAAEKEIRQLDNQVFPQFRQ